MNISRIDFAFAPFSEITLSRKTPTFAFLFEEQKDAVIAEHFPELEEKRKMLDKVAMRGDEVAWVQMAQRNGKLCAIGAIYVEYPWKKRKKFNVGSINFIREVSRCTVLATETARKQKFESMNVLLPDRFSPRNVKSRHQRRDLVSFVRSVIDSIIYANNSYDDLLTDPDPKIKEVTVYFFGEGQPALDGFFRKAIGDGEQIGNALAEVRHLIETPPNKKTPLLFLEKLLRQPLVAASEDVNLTNGFRKMQISSCITASVLYGLEALESKGFGLISAVGKGSRHEPCFLVLHYQPQTKREKRVRRIALIGKGVTFDTGGVDLKGTDSYTNMHFDMAGAANVAGVLRLAEEANLAVELYAVIPIVENTLGSSAVHPHSVVKAYDGKTVEIINTDCEGRLILADAIAYSEAKIKPDVTITVGTLGDMGDFGHDFLKVVATTPVLERKVRVAEYASAEKVLLFPRMDYYNHIDNAHVGATADLVNDIKNPGCYHMAPIVFLYNFFVYQNTNWIFVDPSAIFEEWAPVFGAGPGFGLRFLWHLVEQFA